MFGWFKKKEAAPAPDPNEVKVAERIKVQTEIAELQSQIAELQRQSAQMAAEIAKKSEARAELMGQIQSAPPARKTALALEVKNLDKSVAGLNANLALIQQQIGNNESTVLQLRAKTIVDTGDVGNVVDAKTHQDKLQEATRKKTEGDLNAEIADSMLAGLTGDPATIASDVADILAEAEGLGQGATAASASPAPAQSAPEAGGAPSPRPMTAPQH